MTWHDDLRHIDWNGSRYTVLDRIKEEGRVYLGLAPYDEVAGVASARDAGRPQPLPSRLAWVEEKEGGVLPLSPKDVDRLMKRKSERAMEAFKRT